MKELAIPVWLLFAFSCLLFAIIVDRVVAEMSAREKILMLALVALLGSEVVILTAYVNVVAREADMRVQMEYANGRAALCGR